MLWITKSMMETEDARWFNETNRTGMCLWMERLPKPALVEFELRYSDEGTWGRHATSPAFYLGRGVNIQELYTEMIMNCFEQMMKGKIGEWVDFNELFARKIGTDEWIMGPHFRDNEEDRKTDEIESEIIDIRRIMLTPVEEIDEMAWPDEWLK